MLWSLFAEEFGPALWISAGIRFSVSEYHGAGGADSCSLGRPWSGIPLPPCIANRQ
jgi:hypothetical protein